MMSIEPMSNAASLRELRRATQRCVEAGINARLIRAEVDATLQFPGDDEPLLPRDGFQRLVELLPVEPEARAALVEALRGEVAGIADDRADDGAMRSAGKRCRLRWTSLMAVTAAGPALTPFPAGPSRRGRLHDELRRRIMDAERVVQPELDLKWNG